MNRDCNSGGRQRLNPRIKPSLDGPPQLSPIDRVIDLHHGSTTAIEATPQRLQASKQYPIPSLQERIEQLQKQNSNLNHEVAFYRDMEQSRTKFEHDIVLVKEKLDRDLMELARSQQRVTDDRAQLRQGSNAYTQINSHFI